MKKILHLVNDEKFVQFAYESFKRFPEIKNEFWVVTDRESLKHIQFECVIKSNENFNSEATFGEINQFDLIVIHFLDLKYNKFLKKENLKVKLLWVGWGGDYYWLIDTLKNFHIFKPKTRKLASKIIGFPVLYHLAKKINKFRRRERLSMINKIDYFAPVLEDDFLLIKKNNPSFSPKYIQWNYGNLEDNYIKGFENFVISDNDVLLGNSATLTNNHLDVFKDLKSIDFKEKKIILPLNYGDLNYGRIIGNQAVSQFGGKANVLSDFLAYSEYMNLIKNCSNVIMGHVRQQALGNIIALLYVGAKVYFYEESVTYQFFKKRGFKVFIIEELKQKPELLEAKFEQEEINLHKEKLIQIWGRETNITNTKNVINLINVR